MDLRVTARGYRFPLLAVALAATPVAAQDAGQPRPEDTEVWEPAPPVVDPGAGPDIPAPPPSDAVVLFDGSDLDAWVNVSDGAAAGWRVHDGVFTVVKSAGDIRTKRRFRDYQLHLEWRVPEDITGEGQARGNSGLFVAFPGEGRGAYELQILDSFRNTTYANGMAGSVYKQSIPLANAMRPPGEWQTYDVRWTAPRFGEDGALAAPARMTAFHNGVLIQDDFVLAGATVYRGTPAYDAYDDAPIMLQAHGDPSPPISFRNIWVRELDGGPDVAGVEAVLASLPVAWNARDAEAWVDRFAEASDFTNILGKHFETREANRDRHAQLFATIFANSTLRARILSVRPVGANGAVAELEFTLTGYTRLPPGVEETEPGVLRTRLISMFERVGGDWRIVAAQNTAIHPAALGR